MSKTCPKCKGTGLVDDGGLLLAEALTSGLIKAHRPPLIYPCPKCSRATFDLVVSLRKVLNQQYARIVELEAVSARLEAIVDRPPKTADGARIVIGTTRVWVRYLHDDKPIGNGIVFSATCGLDLAGPWSCFVRFENDQGKCLGGAMHNAAVCYSTRAAAEAAKEKT